MEQVARPKQIRLKGQRGDDDLELKLECIKRVKSEDVPVRVLTKLYGISYSRIRRIREAKEIDVDKLFAKYKPRGQFTKVHHRARAYLKNLFKTNGDPLSLKLLCQMLKDDVQLNVNRVMLNKFLRKKMKLSYKSMK